MTNKTATTIKVDPTIYDQFKVLGIKYKLTLQGLVEKCIYRYVNEDLFRQSINDFQVPQLATATTGSAPILS